MSDHYHRVAGRIRSFAIRDLIVRVPDAGRPPPATRSLEALAQQPDALSVELQLSAIDEYFAEPAREPAAARGAGQEARAAAAPAVDPKVCTLPGCEAFVHLLIGDDQRDLDDDIAIAIHAEELSMARPPGERALAPAGVTRSRAWNRVKELYERVRSFFQDLRTAILGFREVYLPGALVSIELRSSVDGDFTVNALEQPEADEDAWIAARRACEGSLLHSISRLDVSLAVLTKASQIMAAIVTATAHPLSSVKRLFDALRSLYDLLSKWIDEHE